MTIKDLIKQIPEDFHDCPIEIYIDSIRPGDEGYYPLIAVGLSHEEMGYVKVLLDAYIWD